MSKSKTIGCTVISPAFAKVGKEAVRRFKQHTGLPVKVIRCADSRGYVTKLELSQRCPRVPVIYFDADWWALRAVDFGQAWQGEVMLAVQDHGVHDPAAFPCSDCERFKLDKGRYFNSGFMAWDNGRAEHRRVFEGARRHYARRMGMKKRNRPHDPGDQFYLNFAAQGLSAPLVLLPVALNFYMHTVRGGCFPYIPRNVIGLHAAGVPVKGKLGHLRAASRVLGVEMKAMLEGAIRTHHAGTFELR